MIRQHLSALLCITFAVLAATAQAAPTVYAGNGNTYDYIAGNVSYSAAKAAAEAMQINGEFGHLATITSQAENDFILSTFALGAGAGQFAWIGGTDSATENIWLWDGGPEDGMQFSVEAVPVPPLNYANWGGAEPNDSGFGEDYALINLGGFIFGIESGKWGDGADIVDTLFVGYIVEFETTVIPLPPALLLMGSAIAGLGFRRRRG